MTASLAGNPFSGRPSQPPRPRLLLDASFPQAAAARLRALGHDALSVHDQECPGLAAASDAEVWAAAVDGDRALVTENAADYSRIEASALARGGPLVQLILTAPRDFPRGVAGTTDRLVTALDAISIPAPTPAAKPTAIATATATATD